MVDSGAEPDLGDYGERLRLSADPATPQTVLAELAYRHAELRPLIAANPAAYEGLLEWLISLGEPAVLAAINSRNAVSLASTDVNGYAATVVADSRTVGAFVAPSAPNAAASSAPKSKKRKLIAFIATGVAGLLAIGGGAFAVNALLSGGSATESAKAFPASTYSWAEFAIDPSIGQKLAAVRVLDKLPGLKELLDDEGPNIDYDNPDIKRSLWEYIFENDNFSNTTSLDYETDVKPWLGSRVAFGLIGEAATQQEASFYAIEASDTEQGIETVRTLLEDSGATGLQVSSYNGYVVVASAEVDLKQAYASGSLADTAGFKGSTSKIGGWGLAAQWVSPYKAASAQLARMQADSVSENGTSLAEFEDITRANVEDWQQEIAEYQADCPRNATYRSSYCQTYSGPSEEDFFDQHGWYPDDWLSEASADYDESLKRGKAILASAETLVDSIAVDASYATSLRIFDIGVESVTATSGMNLPEFAHPEHAAAIADLSDSTIAAVSVSQLGSIVDTVLSPEYFAMAFASLAGQGTELYFSQLMTYGGDLFPAIAETGRDNFERAIKDGYGLSVPDDLNSLFGSNALLIADKDFACAVRDFNYSDGECSNPGIALLVYSDDTRATANTMEDVIDSIGNSFSSGLDVIKTDDRVAVSRGSYGQTVLDGTSTKLRSIPRFTIAVPDLAGSTAAAYVDVRAVLKEVREQARQYPETSTEYLDYYDGIDAFGWTVSKTGNGDASLRMRIVVGSE